jgi:hypothetical protein
MKSDYNGLVEQSEINQSVDENFNITDPEAALQNHLRLNPAPSDAHLFAWKHPRSGLRLLSKTQVTNKLAIIAK